MDTRYLDGFIGELLHINDVSENRLIDLGAGGGAGTYILSHTCADLCAYALKTAAERLGKTGVTVLLNSAAAGEEQYVNRQKNTFEWKALGGKGDAASLHAFIKSARQDLLARGNNPLFLSVGALKWRVAVKENGKEKLRDVKTPFLIFPIRLIVTSKSAPVTIEFIDDEIYINPCLIAKLEQVLGGDIVAGFPKFGGVDLSEPVDEELLLGGTEYFAEVEKYVAACDGTGGADGGAFSFDKDCVAISQYKHDELCTYYDIRRNRDKIYSHPLVERVFSKTETAPEKADGLVMPDFVLPRDSVQESIIARAVSGQSLIVKGPPGTGKTVTIANTIAGLLSQGKRVLFASKKLSALTEVYAKLPEKLRKFTMLLDGETESASAKINPEEIKKDFKKLLADVKSYRKPVNLEADMRQAEEERAKAMRALSAYIELAFKAKCIAGDSFYAALDEVCRRDMPVVEFASVDDVKKVDREGYNKLSAAVGEAETAYNALTGGVHPVYKCPWFGIDVGCDLEGAMAALTAMTEDIEALYSLADGCARPYGIDAGEITLEEAEALSDLNLSADGLAALIAFDRREEILKDIERRLADLLALGADDGLRVQTDEPERLEAQVIKLGALSADDSLTLDEMRLLYDCSVQLSAILEAADGETMKSIVRICDDIKAVATEITERVSASQAVFKDDLSDGEKRRILSAAPALSGYFSNCPEKPKTFDFKAKKAYKNLCALSFLSAPSFKDITGATEQFALASEAECKLDAVLDGLYKIFRKKLTEREADCVRLLARKRPDGVGIGGYTKAARAAYPYAEKCFSMIPDGDGITFSQLKTCFERAYRTRLLADVLKEFDGAATVYGESDSGKEVETARNLLGLNDFVLSCKKVGAADGDIVRAAIAVGGQGGKIKPLAVKICASLESFGEKYFRNYFAINGAGNSLSDLKILVAEAGDRNKIAAAYSYSSVKNNSSDILDLGEFLYYFEKGGKLPAGATFKDAFAHSFFSIGVRGVNADLGVMRNGLGGYVKGNIEKLRAADEKINALNADLIESRCVSRIDADGDGFAFVQDRNPNEKLRLTFKRNAEAILKLKRCLILSPYTASLLFRGEEYEKFDVLIVDEASQLEPPLVLPVLFRAKQCIIVGDEWQMPPIKHFVSSAPVSEGDGEDGYSSLESEISVLGLALRNGAFKVEELICHYRSKTETLIKFSQEAFYPNMRTFPAPVPARAAQKGVAGLGLFDNFVADGIVSAGRNPREAEEVVKVLKEHFDNYYDPATHALSLSVGVVAFGEAQCDEIEQRVRADKKLSAMIDDAFAHFNDLPEKLVFFKTIETVQGQETGHLILSLTHGRREGGLNMNFGQLNQGKLGRCIFNVAVTRAQYMVTVVHSVRADEVTGDSVSYIRDYLKIVERFNSGDREKFLSEDTDSGFIKSVADFIISQGFESERVVINYGVTNGSVRIPIAVLSKDLSTALMAVWCERPVGGKYDYVDYNMRYRNSLKQCGWNVYDVYIHDWTDNAKSERDALKKALENIKNK